MRTKSEDRLGRFLAPLTKIWTRKATAALGGIESHARLSGAYWDGVQSKGDDDVLYWLAVPMLAHEINRRTTGDPGTWPLTAFAKLIEEHLPVRRALSIGCGTGNLEREVARAGAALQVDGIDVGEASIRRARELAEAEGFGEILHYQHAEAAEWLRLQRGGDPYDLIFFHGSLHHIEALEKVLDLCAAFLREGSPGLMYVDEYVGPSRHEWRSWHVGYANGLFGRVAEEHRRAAEVLPPIAWEDPTEMIRSSEILPAIRERFEIVHERPYYGNVLFPLATAIKGSSLESSEVLKVLRDGIQLENYLAVHELVESLFTVLVARPRKS